MLAATVGHMSRRALVAASRVQTLARHMTATTSQTSEDPEILFESNLGVRRYILDRPSKLNALNLSILEKLQQQIEVWGQSELCSIIVGSGNGRAFCAGGDVADVVANAANEETRPKALEFFRREFEVDFILANLQKPYVVLMNGFTLGGGVGLAANAPFRIATEKTVFAMPETKIGYFPDVGASFFLNGLDGRLGTYLALTGAQLKGRNVFMHRLATHYVPSNRLPQLLTHLAALDNPSHDLINATIEELYEERMSDEPPPTLIGVEREALDVAFGHDEVEDIMEHLKLLTSSTDKPVSKWAQRTTDELHKRSPTSLKVALRAIREGATKPLLDCLRMELRIATAYCRGASSDFNTGVTAVLIEKDLSKEINWSPNTLADVQSDMITRNFFSEDSPFTSGVPSLIPDQLAGEQQPDPNRYTLPSERDIDIVVRGAGGNSANTGVTVDELLSRFQRSHHNKHGLKEKILDVVQRRCEVTDFADKNYRWLKWKH